MKVGDRVVSFATDDSGMNPDQEGHIVEVDEGAAIDGGDVVTVLWSKSGRIRHNARFVQLATPDLFHEGRIEIIS